MVALLPMPALAEESGGDELDIPEIVLEHLADAYEWHIASYEGKHLSIPLPIIIRSENTGEWHFCTAHSLPEGFFFSEEHHGKIYEHMAVIDENPVYFEDCEGVSLRDCDGENDGVVRFDLKNASFKVFHWNTTTLLNQLPYQMPLNHHMSS